MTSSIANNETVSQPVPSAPPAPFAVTDAAAARIVKISQGEPAGTKFRVSVLGGGCSGFQYHFDFDAAAAASDDLVIAKNGVIPEIVIPAKFGISVFILRLLTGLWSCYLIFRWASNRPRFAPPRFAGSSYRAPPRLLVGHAGH